MESIPERIKTPSSSKFTIWFFIFSGVTIYCFSKGLAESLELAFDKSWQVEPWRLLTSVFATHNIWTLLLNIFYIFILSCLSESERGSVYYIFDLVFKVFLVNVFAAAFYVIIAQHATNPDGFLAYCVEIQSAFPSRSFSFLAILEVFLKVVESASDPSDKFGLKLGSRSLKIFFLILVAFNFFRIGFFAALIVAIFQKIGFLVHMRLLQKISFLANLDRKLSFLRSYSYLKHDSMMIGFPETESELNEAKRLDHTIDSRLRYKDDEKVEDETKSRHEEVNVQEYMETSKIEETKAPGMESYEI